MKSYYPVRTRVSYSGKVILIVPRPSLIGVSLDALGRPEAVKYPDLSYWSESGYKLYSTLKGICVADWDKGMAQVLVYELKDKTLLMVDPEGIRASGTCSHNANSADNADLICYEHRVDSMRLVTMSELIEDAEEPCERRVFS